MIKQRVLSALVLIPIIFVAVWFGGPFYYLVVAVVATLGALEFFGMRGLAYRHPLTLFGLLCVLLLIVSAHYKDPETFTETCRENMPLQGQQYPRGRCTFEARGSRDQDSSGIRCDIHISDSARVTISIS